MSSTQHIKDLIETGQEANIELALQLCIGQGQDFLKIGTSFLIKWIHQEKQPCVALVLFRTMWEHDRLVSSYLRQKLSHMYKNAEDFTQATKWHGQNRHATMLGNQYIDVKNLLSSDVAFIRCLIKSGMVLSARIGRFIK